MSSGLLRTPLIMPGRAVSRLRRIDWRLASDCCLALPGAFHLLMRSRLRSEAEAVAVDSSCDISAFTWLAVAYGTGVGGATFCPRAWAAAGRLSSANIKMKVKLGLMVCVP